MFEYECELCGRAFDSEISIEPAILCADCLKKEASE
jgi:DNA-directed RNA polymerase subunit RPC12/RpoP